MGEQGQSTSTIGGDISGDGNLVAFSYGFPLTPNEEFVVPDVYLRNLTTGETTILSENENGESGNGWSKYPAISDDGRVVAFQSDSSNLLPGLPYGGLFIRDFHTGTLEVVPGFSAGDLSADGRLVAIATDSSALVAGDNNAQPDVFVYDRVTDQAELISVSMSGGVANNFSQLPSMSADGRFVVFGSRATDLVEGDTSDRLDIFVRDRQLQVTERVSVSSDGVEGNLDSYGASISADGRFVAFDSDATSLVSGTSPSRNVFLRDRATGTTERLTGNQVVANYGGGDISDDGRMVTFGPFGGGSVWVRDRQTGKDIIGSVRNDGTGTGASGGGGLSADGRSVVFSSWDGQVVEGDTNNWEDIFVHRLDISDNPEPTVGGVPGELPGTGGRATSGGDGARVLGTLVAVAAGGWVAWRLVAGRRSGRVG